MTDPTRYRKKPVVVDAIRYQPHENCAEVARFTGEGDPGCCDEDDASTEWSITTLEGTMTAQPGDWIIRGVKGELYPCKPDVFEATYEAVAAEDRTTASDSAFTAYAVGVCNASVCTSLSDDEATARLNLEHPTGIGPWFVAADSHFADGTHTNPCPCEDKPDTHRHILFHC